jgi:pilus assembly protein Flp/PilA
MLPPIVPSQWLWHLMFLLWEGDPMSKRLFSHAAAFLKNEDGPTAVEYAVMLALIIVVCIAAISALGSNASNTFQYVGNKISTTSS